MIVVPVGALKLTSGVVGVGPGVTVTLQAASNNADAANARRTRMTFIGASMVRG